ncbi:hypothetical protein ACFWBS_28360 [Streptomyces mirabilis]|uniref:hypothetical protein n=1 Tax=Streptomyces mirabilis TaxID=68239 RepID=UPI00365327D1
MDAVAAHEPKEPTRPSCPKPPLRDKRRGVSTAMDPQEESSGARHSSAHLVVAVLPFGPGEPVAEAVAVAAVVVAVGAAVSIPAAVLVAVVSGIVIAIPEAVPVAPAVLTLI